MMRAAVWLAATALGAAPAVALPDRFDVGRGPQGELCQATRVWNDPAATSLFDTVYSVRCRGWTDTTSVGRVGLFGAGSDTVERVNRAVAERMACSAAGAVTLAGVGQGKAARCRNGEGGYAAFAATVALRRQIIAADGLERFSGNLALLARALVDEDEGAAKGEARPVALDTLPAPPPAAEVAGMSDAQGLAGRRSEVIEYSVRGQHGEARELATRYLAQLPPGASAGDRADFTLEYALASSNLGYAEAAAGGFAQARALLAGVTGAAGEQLGRKLAVYLALDALNRRAFADALQLADSAIAVARTSATTAQPLADLQVLGELNASNSRTALARRDQSWVGPTILAAQVHHARAVALRALGRFSDAPGALATAEQYLARFDASGFDSNSLNWLRSAVAAERGRAAQRLNDLDGARAAFGRAVSTLERSSVYAATPLLAQRQIELANVALAAGDRNAARANFNKGFAVLRALGPSTASSVSGLGPYLELLASDAAGSGGAAADAAARLFEASQLISPPAVAGQIAQLQKIFESGTSDGAVKAKTLQDLDREARVLSNRLVAMAGDAPDRAVREAELASLTGRAAQVRAELAGDQQYQQASESVATLAEVQQALRPGEAYFKLVTLADHSYGMLVKRQAVRVYRTGMASEALDQVAKTVRTSIDGTRSGDGRTIVLVFDVAGAHQLHQALLGGAGDWLADVRTLITEPTGPMTQLPYGVLVEDKASVDAFEQSVRRNSRDYTAVAFLVRGRRVDSAVSPRSFLVSRQVTASRAPLPYIGFGNHAPPSEAALAALPQRGAFQGQCVARADALRAGFASLRPVGAAELAAARTAMGQGAEVVEQAAFTDTRIDDPRGLGDRLRRFAVLHFATHGLKEGELECDSPPALVTSIDSDARSDGLLSFEEIAGLSLDANLVALSACNTAASASTSLASQTGFRNEMGQAATLNGLARAFLVAGSRAVLTTHWAIPDSFRSRDGRTIEASTRLIAGMFAAARMAPMGDALRQAQVGMLGTVDTSHPYYWGAFMLVGDGARPMLGQPGGSGR